MGAKVRRSFASSSVNIMGERATGIIGKQGRAALDASGQDRPSGSPDFFEG